MYTFHCSTCDQTFIDQGTEKKWRDPIIGPCRKRVATCPQCHSECGEYRPSATKKSADYTTPSSSSTCSSGVCGL